MVAVVSLWLRRTRLSKRDVVFALQSSPSIFRQQVATSRLSGLCYSIPTGHVLGMLLDETLTCGTSFMFELASGYF